MAPTKQDNMPVIRDLRDFDRRSGNLLERLVFNHRPLFMLLMALATVVLGYMAVTRLELRPSFEKMIPQSQPYIQNYLENRQSLRGLGNTVASAMSSMNSGRWLNTSRSSRLPECRSKSGSSRITGMVSCFKLPMSGYSL